MSNWTALLFGIAFNMLVNVGYDFLREKGPLIVVSGIICVLVNIIFERLIRKDYK